MKIHILFELKDGATGGGNQFLKAIKDYFIKAESYTKNIKEADVILYNSYQYIPKLVAVKQQFPDKLFVHRIDGPIRLYNTMYDRRDFVTNSANKLIADGTIFQSSWSKDRNLEMGILPNRFEATIMNAPNPNIFNTNDKEIFNKKRKIKLISTSWSANIKKGFNVYKWLDKNLDFRKYEMIFIGNSSIKFENIILKKPMNSEELSKELKKSDIFITASQKDPCSNSLIEALHCGLPAVGLNDGGHTEIIGDAGLIFKDKKEIPNILNEIVNNYEKYTLNMQLPNIDEVGEKYFNFLSQIFMEQKNNNYKPKEFNFFNLLNIKKTLFLWKLNNRFINIKTRLLK